MIMVVVAVVILRFKYTNGILLDQLVNRSLAWGAGAMLGLQRGVAPELGPAMYLFTLGCLLMVFSGAYGVVCLWQGDDPQKVRARQPTYDRVHIALAFTLFLLGIPALRRGLLTDQYFSWVTVATWTVFGAPMLCGAVRVWRIGWRELHHVDTTVKERLVYLAMLAGIAALISDAVAGPLVAAVQAAGAWRGWDPNMVRKAWTASLSACLCAVPLAFPAINKIADQAGWNEAGAAVRRLRPLWQDLTTAVPSVVLPAHLDLEQYDTARVRLHRMIIEIDDALLHLKRHCPDGDLDPYDPDTHSLASRIAAAIECKSARVPPSAGKPRSSEPPPRPGPRDHRAELRQLLVLAHTWRQHHPTNPKTYITMAHQ